MAKENKWMGAFRNVSVFAIFCVTIYLSAAYGYGVRHDRALVQIQEAFEYGQQNCSRTNWEQPYFEDLAYRHRNGPTQSIRLGIVETKRSN